MTDRLSHFSNSYFAYLNYRRPSASMGTNTFHSGSSRITDKFGMRYKWQILAIASCVIIAVTLGIGIYSATLYQNSSTATTDTTTTAVTTSRAITAASTAGSGTTTSSATTMAITTLAVDTTSAAGSTDVVTTKTPPICPSMLAFGDDAGDKFFTTMLNVSFSYTLLNATADKGYVDVYAVEGTLEFHSKNSERMEVRGLYYVPSYPGWSAYYRRVSSKADQDAIACLVKNSQISNASVATWVNTGTTELQAFQLIIASFEPSATYVIRIYSENLPDANMPDPVQIYLGSDDVDLYYFTDVKVQDVAGQRQIFDVSKALDEGQDLTVVEEGKNCNGFIC